MKSENIALFDLDGTLVDFDKAMKRDLKLLANPDEDIDPWDMTKPWIRARRRMIMRQPGWWKYLDKFQLGFDILRETVKLDFVPYPRKKAPTDSPTRPRLSCARAAFFALRSQLPPNLRSLMSESRQLPTELN